ncbi:MAG: hypothetical protein HZB16_21765 [Armatimonadetes bacterium]|nr:hypothetical protein [Armatimonadota bacterium]
MVTDLRRSGRSRDDAGPSPWLAAIVEPPAAARSGHLRITIGSESVHFDGLPQSRSVCWANVVGVWRRHGVALVDLADGQSVQLPANEHTEPVLRVIERIARLRETSCPAARVPANTWVPDAALASQWLRIAAVADEDLDRRVGRRANGTAWLLAVTILATIAVLLCPGAVTPGRWWAMGSTVALVAIAVASGARRTSVAPAQAPLVDLAGIVATDEAMVFSRGERTVRLAYADIVRVEHDASIAAIVLHGGRRLRLPRRGALEPVIAVAQRIVDERQRLAALVDADQERGLSPAGLHGSADRGLSRLAAEEPAERDERSMPRG